MDPKRRKGSSSRVSPFPDEVLEKVLFFLNSKKDRSSVSLVCKDWYNAERWSRRQVFIGNCYSVSPEIVASRFPKITSVTLKGKPRFSDFNLVPDNWGADLHQWLVVFASAYPDLEELRLKRMTVTDESLYFLAISFPNFKALSLVSCDKFTTNGLAEIATHCRNLTEFDIQENAMTDYTGSWLSCFPETFTSLEILNFASTYSEISFDVLERLVSRCKSLKVLKVSESINLEQVNKLLLRAPQLTELGTGIYQEEELTPREFAELECAFSKCKKLNTISGLWGDTSFCLPVLYTACANLTFLNLSYAGIGSGELVKLLACCSNLRRLWVMDTVEDKGLEAVGSNCHSLEELRVFPSDPYSHQLHEGVTETGFISVSQGCPKLRYVLYFCRQMTNAAVATVINNCPDFTHFRLCIMTPGKPDYVTNEPMDEAFGAVVKGCKKLRRLSVSGLLTDLTFEYIGEYAKNLETLSVAFAGDSDRGMQYVLAGCPKLRKLEIRDCPFGNTALLSGLEKYESMRSLWMSGCKVSMSGCRQLAREKPRLNVEVMKKDESDMADKVYVYRSVAGPRRDAPPFVLTL